MNQHDQEKSIKSKIIGLILNIFIENINYTKWITEKNAGLFTNVSSCIRAEDKGKIRVKKSVHIDLMSTLCPSSARSSKSRRKTEN